MPMTIFFFYMTDIWVSDKTRWLSLLDLRGQVLSRDACFFFQGAKLEIDNGFRKVAMFQQNIIKFIALDRSKEV
jgi:hypothetical protein